MAKAPKAFDVWFVAANTVYKGVPYTVVADWVREGRLAPSDMARPAGTSVAWARVANDDLLADYLPRPAGAKSVPAAAATTAGGFEVVAAAEPHGGAEEAELPEPEPPPRRVGRPEDDDEVDMIPLIDISMVLLVFFIMMRAAGALAPVDVPEMKYAAEPTGTEGAITINIDKIFDPTKTPPERVGYSLRRGKQAPRAEHGPDKLDSPEKAIQALDELLQDAAGERAADPRQRAPDVLIACHKTLPTDRVLEIQAELEKRKKKQLVNSYAATVIEAPKK